MPVKEMSIQELARDFSIHLHRMNRRDQSTYLALVDGCPEWMRDIARRVHHERLPNDWTYRFIKDAVDIIKQSSDEDEARSLIVADESYGNLTEWLGSRMDRLSYCDEAMQCMRGYTTICDIMQDGQYIERYEVFQDVYNELRILSDNFRFMIKDEENGD